MIDIADINKLYIFIRVLLALAVPFELGVDFNDDEFCSSKASGVKCEFYSGKSTSTTGGGGILGFSLCYAQKDS